MPEGYTKLYSFFQGRQAKCQANMWLMKDSLTMYFLLWSPYVPLINDNLQLKLPIEWTASCVCVCLCVSVCVCLCVCVCVCVCLSGCRMKSSWNLSVGDCSSVIGFTLAWGCFSLREEGYLRLVVFNFNSRGDR